MNIRSGNLSRSCFIADCPMCMESRTFFLLEKELGLSGEFLVLGVACAKCHYEALTHEEEERTKLLQACAIWMSRQSGRYTEQEAAKLLDDLQSRVLAKIREEGTTWVCDACHEKNAMSFLECWNCQRERPNKAPEPTA